jgi:N-acetylmuramoyl-L-alanine amidase
MKPKYITLHCADTFADMDIGFKEIDSWHKANGWDGCGYHKIIRRDGTVENGRPLNVMGAHVGGHNKDNLGICVVGGKARKMGEDPNNFTDAQFKSLAVVVKELQKQFNISNDNVKGHNDWPSHASRKCPVFTVEAFKKTYL